MDRIVEATDHGLSIGDYVAAGQETVTEAMIDSWSEDRTVSAEELGAAILKLAGQKVDPRGMRLAQLKIVGDLDLNYCDIGFPVGFCQCVFDGRVSAKYARFVTLTLAGSQCRNLLLDATRTESALSLNALVSAGKVGLNGAPTSADNSRSTTPTVSPSSPRRANRHTYHGEPAAVRLARRSGLHPHHHRDPVYYRPHASWSHRQWLECEGHSRGAFGRIGRLAVIG